MNNLFESFGCAMVARAADSVMIGGVPGCPAWGIDAFMSGLDNAWSMTYRPMLTEPRYIRDAETSAVFMKHVTAR